MLCFIYDFIFTYCVILFVQQNITEICPADDGVSLNCKWTSSGSIETLKHIMTTSSISQYSLTMYNMHSLRHIFKRVQPHNCDLKSPLTMVESLEAMKNYQLLYKDATYPGLFDGIILLFLMKIIVLGFLIDYYDFDYDDRLVQYKSKIYNT